MAIKELPILQFETANASETCYGQQISSSRFHVSFRVCSTEQFTAEEQLTPIHDDCFYVLVTDIHRLILSILDGTYSYMSSRFGIQAQQDPSLNLSIMIVIWSNRELPLFVHLELGTIWL